ncbi:MAG: periplasmic heavy metal sensor [Desulfamplus sp.]|nr:periplasmic heavy metal sensor [Desulfamplus sp.]
MRKHGSIMQKQETIIKKQGGVIMQKQGDIMKKPVILTIAVVFTMITIVGTAFAGHGAGRKGCSMNSDNYAQACSQEWANLTDDQKSKLKTLHQKFIDETAVARASMISKREEMKIFMETSSPDKAKLHALSAELTELQKQVMDKKIDLALDAKKIAPELDISMIMDGHGGMGKGMGRLGKGMMGRMGGMMGKGKGKMNCPAMSAHDNDDAQNNDTEPQENQTDSDHSGHKSN